LSITSSHLNHDSGSKRTLEIDLTHCEATAVV